MHYIQNRLNAIREHINDFYSSFTVVNMSLHSGKVSELERQKEEDLFSGLDKQVEIMEVLPPEPKQKDFATIGLFLKAQANWRLLKGRFELIERKRKQAGNPPAKPAQSDDDGEAEEL